MPKQRKIIYRIIFTIVYFLIIREASAAPGPPLTLAECRLALQVTTTVNMNFGSYIESSSGTIDMDASGNLTPSGVTLLGGTAGTPVTYSVSNPGKGCSSFPVTITVIPDIAMSGPSGDIPVTNLASMTSEFANPVSNQFSLNKTNPYTVTIGGRLTAGGETDGIYTGNFVVIFDH